VRRVERTTSVQALTPNLVGGMCVCNCPTMMIMRNYANEIRPGLSCTSRLMVMVALICYQLWHGSVDAHRGDFLGASRGLTVGRSLRAGCRARSS
jgi:hypothetical protein